MHNTDENDIVNMINIHHTHTPFDIPRMKERLLVSCNSRLVDIQAIFISQPDSSERWQSDFSVLFVFDKEIDTSFRVHVNGNLKLVLCSG